MCFWFCGVQNGGKVTLNVLLFRYTDHSPNDHSPKATILRTTILRKRPFSERPISEHDQSSEDCQAGATIGAIFAMAKNREKTFKHSPIGRYGYQISPNFVADFKYGNLRFWCMVFNSHLFNLQKVFNALHHISRSILL
jgi:hypothetical protein